MTFLFHSACGSSGALYNIFYSDATPAVSLAYDAFQRLAAASNAVAAYVYANSALGATTSEVVTLNGHTVTLARELDEHHRLAALRIGPDALAHCGYDAESRLAAVSNDAFAVNYAYTDDAWDAGYTITLTVTGHPKTSHQRAPKTSHLRAPQNQPLGLVHR